MPQALSAISTASRATPKKPGRYSVSWTKQPANAMSRHGRRAIIYIGLDQKSAALDWLEKGCEEHDGSMWTMRRDPWYAPLRNEPRFQALLRKIGPNK